MKKRTRILSIYEGDYLTCGRWTNSGIKKSLREPEIIILNPPLKQSHLH